jgi:hypothetical protein
VTLFEVSAFKRIDFGILKLLSLVAFDLIDLGALTLLGLIICKLLDMIILKLHRWLAMIHMISRRNQRNWCRDFAWVTIFLQPLSDSSSRRRPGSSVFRISPVNA